MFTINVADKHKVLSDLMNIFGKLHQKGFSDEQILNICHTFFKSEVEDNIDFCLKINKLESCASHDEIDQPTLHFKINIDFINKILKIQKAVECVRELSGSIFALDGEKVVLDSNTDILKRISNGEKTKPSLPEIQSQVSSEDVKQITEEPTEEINEVENIENTENTENVAEATEVEEVAEVQEASGIAESDEPESISEPVIEPESAVESEVEEVAEEVVEVAETEEITTPEITAEPEPLPEVEAEIGDIDLGSEISKIGEIGGNPKNNEISEPISETSEPEIAAEIPDEPVAEINEIPEIDEIAEPESVEPTEVSETTDDLNLDFPTAENQDVSENVDVDPLDELPDNLDADLSELPPPPPEEIAAETNLEDDESLSLDSLDDLDFSMATESDLAELEGNSPSEPAEEAVATKNVSEDDVLLELSDPTEADLAALQEKLSQMEQQQ